MARVDDRRVTAASWVIWLLSVLFYLYEFFLRYSPAVMVPELMRAFRVDAAQIGTLSAFYLYIYAPLQIPIGVLMDRYGARKLLTIAAFICGLGGLLFGWAPVLWVAEAARVLMGFGSAFAFVGMVYVTTHWFPRDRLAVMIGAGMALGMLGAVGGEGPLSYAAEQLGWRPTSYLFGGIGILLSLVIYIAVRKAPLVNSSVHPKNAFRHMLGNLAIVCASGQTWLNGLVGTFMYATTTAFAGLWGIPSLVALYGIDKVLAGSAVSVFFVGWIVGAPVMGWLSDRLKSRVRPIVWASLAGFCSSIAVIYISAIPIWLMFVLMFATGLFSAAQALNFSISIELNPERASATAAAFTNFLVMLGGSLIQPFVGYLLDISWTGESAAGVPVFTPHAYRIALVVFPLSFLLASLLGLFLREKPVKS